MFKWITLEAAAARLAQRFGKEPSTDDLLTLAHEGVLKICAALPGWRGPGEGEVEFFTYPAGRRIASASDGMYRFLGKRDFEVLQAHRRLVLAGRNVVLPGADGTSMEAVVGPGAPEITVGDLRVSEAEVERLLAEISDDGEAGDDGKALVGWQRATLESWDEILKSRPRGGAVGRHAMRWLKKNGPRDVIPVVQPKGDEMAWLTGDGKGKSVALKTVQNAIARWVKEGRIPEPD